ncbi:MAG TPA: FGGY family carbohydrate kinase, partial [Gemmatales bacterium]|nr:FGGY family carbohydrate kinase [Gemmatales bacterium]
MSYLLALDQGTTSSRAIVFDRTGNIAGLAQKEFPQLYPQPGWVEHNPLDLWETQAAVAQEALAKAGISSSEVAGLGITNQRETVVLWDRRTGQPVGNAIVWQDRRTAGHCEQLKKEGYEKLIRKRTGLVIDAYFSATKLHWMLKNLPGLRAKAKAGDLAFGTVDTWLVWNLTGGRCHVTDVSNASRTMLMNIKTGDWDDDLLALFQIPRNILPEIC